MPTLPTARQQKPKPALGVARSTERSLARAFASFADAAGSLEISYGHLQAEVVRLRRELEQTNRDLSRSLEENQRMRTYLGRILEGLPCGVLVADRNRHVRIANPEARQLLGLEPNLLPEDLPSIPVKLRGLLGASPEEASATEQEWLREGPKGLRYVGVRRAVLREDGDSEGDVILILRDRTEEKRLESEREATQRTQALAEMAMLLAHEIRNPLGSLELFAGLLADATESHPDARQWVDHLQAGLRALSATVNNVLQFHSQPGTQTLPTSIVRLLRETVEFLQPLARQRGMQIDFVSPSQEIKLPADPHRLQQVFFNLALNAFRAMLPGGCLRIRVGGPGQDPDNGVQIVFEDQGSGIAPENFARIFDPGFTTTPGSPGLGLAVSKKTVEQHGGNIRVESVPGQGSTFILNFPASGAAG